MPIIGLISGFFTFFPEVVALIKSLQATPLEKRQQAIAAVHAAIKKTSETGDTSDEEGIISG